MVIVEARNQSSKVVQTSKSQPVLLILSILNQNSNLLSHKLYTHTNLQYVARHQPFIAPLDQSYSQD